MPPFRLMLSAAALAGGLGAAPALAQTAPNQPPPSQPPAARQHAFTDRFNAANTTHDGRLTRAQAEAGHLPMVASHFDAIDTQHKGYITPQDLQAYRQQMRAARAQQPQQSE